jgi:hypothetical protein
VRAGHQLALITRIADPVPLTYGAGRLCALGRVPGEPACAVRRPKGVKWSFALILLAAVMTAGCATSAMTAAVVTKAGTGGSARPASPSSPAPSPAAGQRIRQQAEAAAAALLAEFVPPPGARRLAGPPDLPGGGGCGTRVAG